MIKTRLMWSSWFVNGCWVGGRAPAVPGVAMPVQALGGRAVAGAGGVVCPGAGGCAGGVAEEPPVVLARLKLGGGEVVAHRRALAFARVASWHCAQPHAAWCQRKRCTLGSHTSLQAP